MDFLIKSHNMWFSSKAFLYFLPLKQIIHNDSLLDAAAVKSLTLYLPNKKAAYNPLFCLINVRLNIADDSLFLQSKTSIYMLIS